MYRDGIFVARPDPSILILSKAKGPLISAQGKLSEASLCPLC